MNRDRIECNWKERKGKFKEQWVLQVPLLFAALALPEPAQQARPQRPNEGADMNRLLGTWGVPGEYTAEVQYTISDHQGDIGVAAVDPNDGAATVQVVELSDAHVCFVALWPSSGRESRCRLEIQSNGEAALTLTRTDQVRLLRKHASQ